MPTSGILLGVDKQYITPEYLQSYRVTDDYLLIAETILALRKKHIAAGEPTPRNSHAPTAMT